jgi:putative transposase
MEKFQDKYRIPSARASWWDYSWNGLYFITICTAGRENYFGRITTIVETQDFASPDRSSQDLILPDPASDKNQIKPEIWVNETQDFASLHQIRSIPNNFRGHKKMQLTPLGEMAIKCWIDIPKHFPFVKLDAFVVMPNHVHGILEIDKPGFDNHIDSDVETQDFSKTQNLASLRPNSPSPKNKFGPQSKNLASILRGYKTGVTNFAVANNFDFGWQARYYDHIIRDDQEYIRISDYIVENPEKWDEDKFFRN